MRYDHCLHGRFGVYEDVAEMALLRCNICQGVQARALLWTDAKGGRYLDRVYGAPTKQHAIRAWSREQAFPYIYPGRGLESSSLVRVKVPKPRGEYQGAPYLDTVFYWCDECRELRSKPCKPSHSVAICRYVEQYPPGWWGRCPTCSLPIANEGGLCPRAIRCGICRAQWCYGVTPPGELRCPNGHNRCWDCGQWKVETENCASNACNGRMASSVRDALEIVDQERPRRRDAQRHGALYENVFVEVELA